MRRIPFWAAFAALTACTGGEPPADTDPIPDTDSETDTDTDAGIASWEDVRPIVQDKCARCHSADRLSTYRRLETHAEVTALRSSILDKLEVDPPRGLRMPVASNHTDDSACIPTHAQSNDKRLTEAEIATLTEFMQREDHQDYVDETPLITAPQPVPLADSVTYQSSQYDVLNDGFVTPPSGAPPGYMEQLGYDERDFDQMEDDFLCIVFDPEIDDLSYLTGIQVETDVGQIYLNSQLVIDTNGGFDTARAQAEVSGPDWYHCDPGLGFSGAIPLWRTVPGGGAVELPDQTGFRFEPGWRFVLRVDFHTHFDAEEFERLDQDGVIDTQEGTMTWFDRATVRARWAEPAEVTRELQRMTIGPTTLAERDAFAVPPGESVHTFSASPDTPGDYTVFSAEVGMGKTGYIASIRDTSSDTCVTSNTDFDPKWIEQATYAEADAPQLDVTSTLELSCTFRSDADQPLEWASEGEQTFWGRRERCAGVVFYYDAN